MTWYKHVLDLFFACLALSNCVFSSDKDGVRKVPASQVPCPQKHYMWYVAHPKLAWNILPVLLQISKPHQMTHKLLEGPQISVSCNKHLTCRCFEVISHFLIFALWHPKDLLYAKASSFLSKKDSLSRISNLFKPLLWQPHFSRLSWKFQARNKSDATMLIIRCQSETRMCQAQHRECPAWSFYLGVWKLK